ncbi:molybdopterin molybdotransferase MoeA [bacterium]|nr:molybdopterin molybdotransferase MoeA [bacterium]
MISVESAIDLIVQNAGTQPIEDISLAEAMGQTLAEPVSADIDSPPFDKSLMDGYAIRVADLANGRGSLIKAGEVYAGQPAGPSLLPGQAIQIMTGAAIPLGADAVVMIERTQSAGDQIMLDDPELMLGQNIMKKSLEFARDETLLWPGHTIGPAEAGLLASVGKIRIQIFRPVTISILSTGNEIVPPSQYPQPGQIRNSNASTLDASIRRVHAKPIPLGIAGDDEKELADKIEQGLSADVLVLSGGVSAGKKDLVPKTLLSLGVEQIFHGVAFKPGKPLWFGKRGESLVFGLPGNPVSVLACFEVFIKTALRARCQHPHLKPIPWRLPLAIPFDYSTRRPTYHPARIEPSQAGLFVRPVSWKGSPDLRALTEANALLMVPAGDGPYPAGTLFDTLPIHHA